MVDISHCMVRIKNPIDTLLIIIQFALEPWYKAPHTHT